MGVPKAVIAGGAETRFSRRSGLADLQLMGQSIRAALADAGLTKDEVNGLAVCANVLPDDSPYLAEHLGLSTSWVMKADYGGASPVISIGRAVEAIEAGHADVVVCVGGGNRAENTKIQHDVVSPPLDYAHRNFVMPFGDGGANSLFGLVQRRHMYEHGTTLEQLGKISVTFRQHAQLNANALLHDPLTIDDYVSSPLISDPIRKLDCVMRCAGAAAVIVTTEEIAARHARRPVYIRAYGERHGHGSPCPSPDRLSTGFTDLHDELFTTTQRQQLDFLQLYDDYPIAVLMQLEGLGFCRPGGGGEFIESTDISLSGELPINTGGGMLSVGQPRLAGGFIGIIEAVRQLRGEAGARQLADAKTGLVTGIGLGAYLGNLVVSSAMILGTEAVS